MPLGVEMKTCNYIYSYNYGLLPLGCYVVNRLCEDVVADVEKAISDMEAIEPIRPNFDPNAGSGRALARKQRSWNGLNGGGPRISCNGGTTGYLSGFPIPILCGGLPGR